MTLIEKIYNQCQPAIVASNYPDVLLVELCSVAERALNYMHTGNAAVIVKSVMNPLWIGNAIVRDGMPCLNTNMVSMMMKSVSVIAETWPFDHVRHQPKTSSKACQIYSYGLGHFNVSHAAFLDIMLCGCCCVDML